MYTVRNGIPDPHFGNRLLEQFGGSTRLTRELMRSRAPEDEPAEAGLARVRSRWERLCDPADG